MKKETIVGLLIILSTLVSAISLGWYFSPASEHNQITDVYYEGMFYGSFTNSEYEKLQQDTYQKYLELGKQTNSEIIYKDIMPTIEMYFDCTQEQWNHWFVNNSDLAFSNIRHYFDGGCIINIYFIIKNPGVIV